MPALGRVWGEMDLARLTDDDLLAATPGRPEAFGEFYARHEAAILGFMLRRSGEPELAADLAAEAFAAALVSVRRYRPGPAPAAAWLYGIARNVLLRSAKRKRVEDRMRRRLDMPVLPLTEELLERIVRLEGDRRVEELLARLTPEQAQAVRARVIADEPYPDIAARMRCSESVVRQRVSRGLAVLRQFSEETP
jgi:RNA polymerase sigma-70 factor (ECF subfamily)